MEMNMNITNIVTTREAQLVERNIRLFHLEKEPMPLRTTTPASTVATVTPAQDRN
jgi:hypothetical protein